MTTAKKDKPATKRTVHGVLKQVQRLLDSLSASDKAAAWAFLVCKNDPLLTDKPQVGMLPYGQKE